LPEKNKKNHKWKSLTLISKDEQLRRRRIFLEEVYNKIQEDKK